MVCIRHAFMLYCYVLDRQQTFCCAEMPENYEQV